MDLLEQSHFFILQWNNLFPLDREYRKKHGISFNSKKHRKVNQVDVYLEWLEDRLFEYHLEKTKARHQGEKDLKRGEWIKDRVQIGSQEELELFDKIQL